MYGKYRYVACGFSSIKIDYSDYQKSLISRINDAVWSRIVFLPGVRSSGSEFGERTGTNPGSKFRERIWPNPGSAGMEKGTGGTLVRQVWSSEKGMSQTLVWQVRGSEKRQG